MYPTQPSYYSAPVGYSAMQVEISIGARNLIDRDITSKSDPFCVVTKFDPISGKYVEIAKTEVAKNNLNPDWVKKVIKHYCVFPKKNFQIFFQKF